MPDHNDDYKKLLAQKRFLDDIEQGVRFANREVIHSHLPEVNRDTFLSFAVSVGRLRARYLEAAFRLAINDTEDPPDRAEIEELRTRREMFQEARAAFDALREAIERGYVDVRDDGI